MTHDHHSVVLMKVRLTAGLLLFFSYDEVLWTERHIQRRKAVPESEEELDAAADDAVDAAAAAAAAAALLAPSAAGAAADSPKDAVGWTGLQ